MFCGMLEQEEQKKKKKRTEKHIYLTFCSELSSQEVDEIK